MKNRGSMASKVSIIIPAYNEPYLQTTLSNLLSNASGEIEIIVVLDGYWPEPIIKNNTKVTLIHKGQRSGMRSAINLGIRIAKSQYILKCDAHCAFDKDYNQKLINDYEDDWS